MNETPTSPASRATLSESAVRGVPPAMTFAELRALGTVADLPTACRALGIAYQTGLDLVHAGRFPVRVIEVGNRRKNRYRVPVAELLALLGIDG